VNPYVTLKVQNKITTEERDKLNEEYSDNQKSANEKKPKLKNIIKTRKRLFS